MTMKTMKRQIRVTLTNTSKTEMMRIKANELVDGRAVVFAIHVQTDGTVARGARSVLANITAARETVADLANRAVDLGWQRSGRSESFSSDALPAPSA
jgi:hypothetical protein